MSAALSLRAVEAAIEAAFRSQDEIATDEAGDPDAELEAELSFEDAPPALVFAGRFRFYG